MVMVNVGSRVKVGSRANVGSRVNVASVLHGPSRRGIDAGRASASTRGRGVLPQRRRRRHGLCWSQRGVGAQIRRRRRRKARHGAVRLARLCRRQCRCAAVMRLAGWHVLPVAGRAAGVGGAARLERRKGGGLAFLARLVCRHVARQLCRPRVHGVRQAVLFHPLVALAPVLRLSGKFRGGGERQRRYEALWGDERHRRAAPRQRRAAAPAQAAGRRWPCSRRARTFS